jgi:enamine deaminase RidA (YjgF/YER057c/UK114 family)
MAAAFVFTEQIAPGGASIGLPVAEQARSALSGLQRVLAADHELTLEDLLRLRLFVRDLGELPAIEGAIDAHIGSQRPAVSLVELPAGSSPGVALTLDAVAALGAHEQRQIMHLSAPGNSEVRTGLGSPPCSVRFGPWVFVGATAASTGRGVASSPPDAAEGADSMTGRIGEEARAVFAHMAELLRAQDAEPRDVVSVGGWLTFPVRQSDYRPLGDVRRALLTEAGLFPASAAVQVGRVQPGGALLAFEAIAFAPEEPADRERWRAGVLPPPSPLAPYYASARSAGGYVFTCGEVPTGMADPGHPGVVEIQAREVYERLGAHLAAHGASSASVLQQTVFVRRARDGAAVAEAAREFYRAEAPPPTTLLPVVDIGFHPGRDVEVELIAASDGRSADDR